MDTSQLRAQKGDTVSVHYLGRYPGGKVFDTSMEKEAVAAGLYNRARDYKPLQVTLGTGKVIPGFEEALMGMMVNEEKEVTIPPEKSLWEEREPSHGREDIAVQASRDEHQSPVSSCVR